jgi:Tfp pilus assembly protein PilF
LAQRRRTTRTAAAAQRQSAPPAQTGVAWLIGVILCLVTVAVFQEVRTFEFLRWDDHLNVYPENPHLNPVTDESLAFFWRETYFAAYIPVTRTMWVFLADLSGAKPDPLVFHTANLVMHVLNVLLVFLILRLLVRKDWAAGAGALLFAVHPVQVEPVAWVTGMKDQMGGFFSLLATWVYLCYAMTARDRPEAKTAQYLYLAFATVCYVCALLSKPSAVGLPFLVWALDRWAVGRPMRAGAPAFVLWVCCAVPLGLLTRSSEAEAMVRITGQLWQRPFVAGDALAFYLMKIVVPWPLATDYGRTPAFVMRHWWGFANWLVPVALAGVFWWRRKESPWLLAAGAVVVAAVLPVLGLVKFDFQAYSTVADRYLYVGMLGPAYALAYVLGRYPRPAMITITGLVLPVLAVLSIMQAHTWRDTTALFDQTLRVNPRSWVAYSSRGYQFAEQNKLTEAIEQYRIALHLDPEYDTAHNNLGIALARQIDPAKPDLPKLDEAIAHFRLALEYKPVFEEAQSNLGNALYLRGDIEGAIAAIRKALTMNSDDNPARLNLANILRSKGRNDEAAVEYREVLRRAPANEAAQQGLAALGAK